MDVVFYISRYYLQKGDESEDTDLNDPAFKDGTWWPSPDEYTPGFTKDDWLKLLNNPEIIGPVWGGTLAAFYDAGGQGTCTQIGQIFGKSALSIRSYCLNLAKRIHKVTGCPVSIRKNGTTSYWPILFLGKTADSKTPGSFIWRLRDELMEALKEFGIERYLWEKPVIPDENLKIWKISEGKDSTGLPDDVKAALLERKAVSVHSMTKAMAGMSVSQGENFLHGIHKGDFFYLCYASNVQLLGRFTDDTANPSPAIDERMGEEGWYERSYQIIAQSVRTEPYNGQSKWWTPNSNSTCIEVPVTENEVFEELILKPYFGKSLSDLKDVQPVDPEQEKPVFEYYTREDFLSEVFMSPEHLDQLIGLVKRKKNVILQGAPGVGKTFTSKRLAYVMMGMKDKSRIASIQFHQNYSYEDFIMGYKPAGSDFILQTGVFYDFCERARRDPEREYFFIIDEINRGNL